MTCPKCCSRTKIWDSRLQDDAKRRRRECLSCGYRFITIEIDEDLYERMVKQNDQRRSEKRAASPVSRDL